jgi:hypothetical protein
VNDGAYLKILPCHLLRAGLHVGEVLCKGKCCAQANYGKQRHDSEMFPVHGLSAIRESDAAMHARYPNYLTISP